MSIYLLDTPPSGAVVTLTEIKSWLKISSNSEDTLLSSLVFAATVKVERHIRQTLLTTTWIKYMDCVCENITLKRAPFKEIVSFEYLSNGVYVTLPTNKYKVKRRIFGEICNIDMLSHDNACDAIKIKFKTGFGDTASSVPEDIKTAIKMVVSNMHANRGDCSDDSVFVTDMIQSLLISHRVLYIN